MTRRVIFIHVICRRLKDQIDFNIKFELYLILPNFEEINIKRMSLAFIKMYIKIRRKVDIHISLRVFLLQALLHIEILIAVKVL